MSTQSDILNNSMLHFRNANSQALLNTVHVPALGVFTIMARSGHLLSVQIYEFRTYKQANNKTHTHAMRRRIRRSEKKHLVPEELKS